MTNFKIRCKAAIFALMTFLLSVPTVATAEWDDTEYGTNVTKESNMQNSPDGWTAVLLPNITSKGEFNITTYGANTNSSDNSTAINNAIDAAYKVGGGIVIIPSGTWMVANPIDIKSKVVLHLSKNCTLKMQPKGTYPAGKDNYLISNRTLSTVNDVIIEGEGETSVIDGNGAGWWPSYKSTAEADIRPGSIIRIKKGSRHLFRNFKITMAPQTNLTIGMSGNVNNVTVHDVSILNPPAESELLSAQGKGFSAVSHNTDGIPIWGNYVNIYNCDIDTGDDNIVCDDGAHHIHAWNIKCGCGHGMSVGSNTKNVHDIVYENITFQNTTSGFRIKSDANKSGNDQVGTYGAVKNIICRNATMTSVRNPIKITAWYDDDVEDASKVSTPSTVTETTPEFCNITFQNITAGAGDVNSWKHGAPVYLYGRPEMKIHDIIFDNVRVTSKSNKMYLAYCEKVTFKNNCLVKTGSAVTSPYKYQASYSGNFDGTANSTYDDAGTSPVYFNNGEYTVYTANVLNGQTVSQPSDPVDGEKLFKGWSVTRAGTSTVTFPYTINAPTTFYAVWDGEVVVVNDSESLSAPANDKEEVSGECFTTTGQMMTSTTSGGYIKIRTGNNGNTWTFNVTAGYVITGLHVEGWSNNSTSTATITATSVKADGVELLNGNKVFQPNQSTKTKIDLTDFSAKKTLVVTFDNSNINSEAGSKNKQLYAKVSFDYCSDDSSSSIATDINGVENVRRDGNMYNLNGQRVGANHRGIVIVNGKKMVRN